jgi:hypothetical protein
LDLSATESESTEAGASGDKDENDKLYNKSEAEMEQDEKDAALARTEIRIKPY